MRAGFASVDITPKKSCRLAGFDLRCEESVGIHDPLFARAIVIESGGKICAICSLDLLGAPREAVEEIRRLVREQLPVDEGGIFVCATHTHAAPRTIFRSFACYDAEYYSLVTERASEAILLAHSRLHSVRARLTRTAAEGVASYRDRAREESVCRMPCGALLLEAIERGEGDMLVAAFSCHPTVLDEKNLLVTRDLVYGCESRLRDIHPDLDVLFVNGACADISTRYTRLEASFAEVARLGGAWADAMLASLDGARELEGGLAYVSVRLSVPPAEFFGEEERQEVLRYLDEKIDACTDLQQRREYVSCRSVLLRESYGQTQVCEAELGALLLGDALICTLPFEYASVDADALGDAICRKFGLAPIFVCYCNGYEGYLPSGRPLDRDSGYEDIASPFRHDSKQLVARALDRVIASMTASK